MSPSVCMWFWIYENQRGVDRTGCKNWAIDFVKLIFSMPSKHYNVHVWAMARGQIVIGLVEWRHFNMESRKKELSDRLRRFSTFQT